LHGRALFRFEEQKLPANGHSNARKLALGVTPSDVDRLAGGNQVVR
jgi:hypothetical protein